MIKNRTLKLFCLSSLIFMFSCNDLKKIANQMETIKGNQDIIIAKQKEVDKKLAVLNNIIAGLPDKVANVASNKQPATKKPQQKRKNPNPNISHNIELGGSVVLGNPNAKVTITKFTDFQ